MHQNQNHRQKYTALGLMSGTSADGIDAAIIETDGLTNTRTLAAATFPYDPAFASELLEAATTHTATPSLVERLTHLHHEAVQAIAGFLPDGLDTISVIGFHGHTIAHNPAAGYTTQIGNGLLLAERTGRPVVFDFRSADVAAGGHGAPLVPIYHAALAAPLPKPLAIINIGGVANITYIGEDNKLLAFDTGTGNALINDAMQRCYGHAYDASGATAATGTVHEELLHEWLSHPFFNMVPPKSLDRNTFAPMAAITCSLKEADAIATLTAFTAAGIVAGLAHVPEHPKRLLVAGGGVYNMTLRQMLAERSGLPIASVTEVGWNPDSLEAEAFAYLAVRCLLKLPTSFPGTTGVPTPVVGGQIALP
ncbi:MAG: anhydro-N-acetylmuramic acid kinase [Holosporales bacterium]|jgi:anhydro-N-acetylmuramic acid kinase